MILYNMIFSDHIIANIFQLRYMVPNILEGNSSEVIDKLQILWPEIKKKIPYYCKYFATSVWYLTF